MIRETSPYAKKKKKVECVLLVKEGMKNGALFLLREKKVTLP